MPAVITERVFTTPPFGLTLSALLALSVFATPVKPLSNRAPNVTQLSADRGTATALVVQVPGMPPQAVGCDLVGPF
jgi:hypothetical protein